MCAISYYLERDNIMTTGISLVRENAASMAPPRSLWVPFPLGRPLGVANDPDFQHRVIAAALKLFNSTDGPVLEDFPEDAPIRQAESALACPVTFIKSATTATSWQDRLGRELNTLKPWHDLGTVSSQTECHWHSLGAISARPPAAQCGRMVRELHLARGRAGAPLLRSRPARAPPRP